MKGYESTKTTALRKRVRKVHRKAGFAGTLYLLGALALAVLAFLPTLNIGGEDLWVASFYLPVQDALGGVLDWIGVITAVLYLWILLVAVMNFFKCFSKLGWLTRRSSRYVNGYNRNMRAMEEMGKRFSGTLGAIVCLSLLIWVLQASEVALASYAYITLGVGLGVHFLAGLVAGKVSWFDVHGNGGNVEEVKRECGIFVYFFRNVLQLAAVAGILYFFLPKCTIGSAIESWLGGVNPLEDDIIKNVLPVALEALIVLCLFVLIKHATATTEFNRLGMEGRGMKNYRVFSFFVFLLAGGVVAVEYLFVNPETIVYEWIYIAAIALGVFLADCIFKTRAKKEAEEDYDPIGDMERNQTAGQNAYAPQPMPMPAGQPTAIYQQMPAPQAAYQQQPVYIPVYYPYPVQQPMPMSAPTPVEVKITPTPAPAIAPTKAPERIKPEPSPKEKAKEEALDKENAEAVEVHTPLDPNKEWKVRCPRCGKILNVRETSPYHRCPSCDKVFGLRKFQTYVKKD